MGSRTENPSIVSDIAPDRRLRLTFETLVCRLFRDSVQFCSGLVDLVVCVGHHLGGGH